MVGVQRPLTFGDAFAPGVTSTSISPPPAATSHGDEPPSANPAAGTTNALDFDAGGLRAQRGLNFSSGPPSPGLSFDLMGDAIDVGANAHAATAPAPAPAPASLAAPGQSAVEAPIAPYIPTSNQTTSSETEPDRSHRPVVDGIEDIETPGAIAELESTGPTALHRDFGEGAVEMRPATTPAAPVLTIPPLTAPPVMLTARPQLTTLMSRPPSRKRPIANILDAPAPALGSAAPTQVPPLRLRPLGQIPTCGTPARDKPRPVQQGLNVEWQRTVPTGAPVASNATALGALHASSASSVVASMAAAQSGATGACGCASESQMTHSCTEQTQSAQVLQTSAAQHVQRREGGALQHSSLEHAYASMASVSSSMTTPLTTSMAGGGGVRLQRAAAVAPEGAVSLNAFFPPQHVMPDMPMGRRFPSRLGVAASDAAKGAANVATTTAAPTVESPSAREAARIDGMTERVSQQTREQTPALTKMKQTLNAFHVSFTRLGDDALLTGWRPDFEHSLAQLCDEVEARGRDEREIDAIPSDDAYATDAEVGSTALSRFNHHPDADADGLSSRGSSPGRLDEAEEALEPEDAPDIDRDAAFSVPDSPGQVRPATAGEQADVTEAALCGSVS